MADITMCVDNECPMRDRCYRYTAKADEKYQSYADFGRGRGDKHCEMFWDNKNRSNSK